MSETNRPHAHSDALARAVVQVPPGYDLVKSEVTGNLLVMDGDRQIGYLDLYEAEYVVFDNDLASV